MTIRKCVTFFVLLSKVSSVVVSCYIVMTYNNSKVFFLVCRYNYYVREMKTLQSKKLFGVRKMSESFNLGFESADNGGSVDDNPYCYDNYWMFDSWVEGFNSYFSSITFLRKS